MSVLLAIESSCDETSAAIIHNGKMLANVTATQSVHEHYGGVVPELASRAHQQHLIPVVHAAFEQANIRKNDIKAVSFTRGPGLLGSLLVGVSFAKAFALALNVPLIEVNHMEAHILAHFIEDPKPEFPFLCLTVSGGHTQLVKVHSPLSMEVIGETIDDAVGEAFDKSGKLLGLPYPSGPVIDRYAKEGNPHRFQFSKSGAEGLNFSFSGIKTSILYFLRDQLRTSETFIEDNVKDLCASIQQHLIDMLMVQLEAAVLQTGLNQVAIAGGVAANSGLRAALQERSDRLGWKVFVPKFEYCTDNAGMIAMAAHYKYEAGVFSDQEVVPDARLKMKK